MKGAHEIMGYHPPYPSPLCRNCGLEIEHCIGERGEWMHRRSHWEVCADGLSLATPQTPVEVEHILKGRDDRRTA